jgi:hypothetical protein
MSARAISPRVTPSNQIRHCFNCRTCEEIPKSCVWLGSEKVVEIRIETVELLISQRRVREGFAIETRSRHQPWCLILLTR